MKRIAGEIVKRITYGDLVVGSWLLAGLLVYPFVR